MWRYLTYGEKPVKRLKTNEGICSIGWCYIIMLYNHSVSVIRTQLFITYTYRLRDTIGCFCHEVYTDAGTDWLTFRHQIVLNLGLFILHHLF